MPDFTNRLSRESSPYLLQHAHNPVDWYPWSEEALEKAKKEDKPILVSIGYSACHWCHVMERESFENESTAGIMNDHFVNIKIDREERPDLDHIYMDAVQAISGSGGWPLNVFLTPELKPFYGGTYFPPQRAHNRPSWTEVLMGVSQSFREKRNEVDAQAENLTSHLLQSNNFGQSADAMVADSESIFTREKVDLMISNIMQAADPVHGGFGKAPKFPQTFTIRNLLHNYHFTKNPEALRQAILSLDKMALGGIYDQIGGGFARYSTDAEWLAPHFEKMLYDNALLVIVYSEAYQITKQSLYKNVIEQTLDFTERELLSTEGGFYSALDADSEGVEGKFYVWDKNEAGKLFGNDAALLSEYYDITESGNWEHTNILRVKVPIEKFVALKGIDLKEFQQLINKSSDALLQARNKRIRPSLDDKILLGWNALMSIAYCKAYQALGQEKYRELAINNMEFLWKRFKKEGRLSFNHTYKNGAAKYPAFLDDYAFLIQALLELQEITGNVSYLEKADSLTELVIENFSEKETGFFYFTRFDQQDVVVRKKELYDGAIPSGNSTMAWNLYYLGVVLDKGVWRERAIRMCSSLDQLITKYPTSFGVWATFFQSLTFGIPEIALIGQNIESKHQEILRTFIPPRIFQSSIKETNDYPLLAGKPVSTEGKFFHCREYTCQQPVNEVDELIELMSVV